MTEFGEREARRRHELHKAAGDYREPIGDIDGYLADLKGVEVEVEFGRLARLPIPQLFRPGGDKGWDFIFPWWVSDTMKDTVLIETRAASKPWWLISPVGKTKPDQIYVLGHFRNEDRTAHLQGWQWGREMIARRLKYGPKVIGGMANDWWPNKDDKFPDETLIPIEELLRRRI